LQSLGELRVAHEIALEADEDELWTQLGQVATMKSDIGLAAECLEKANDFGGRLLLASSLGSRPMVFY
jgi:coatomer subunit beta'